MEDELENIFAVIACSVSGATNGPEFPLMSNLSCSNLLYHAKIWSTFLAIRARKSAGLPRL